MDKYPRDENFFNPKKAYSDYRNYLEKDFSISSKSLEDYQKLSKWHQMFHHHYREFLVQGTAASDFQHWRTSDGQATRSLGDDVPRELAGNSLARLIAVQFFEMYNEFDLQDKSKKFIRPDQVDGYKPNPNNRQWFGKDYQVFEVPAHFQACCSFTFNFPASDFLTSRSCSVKYFNLLTFLLIRFSFCFSSGFRFEAFKIFSNGPLIKVR